ncbi:chaplin [Streptomyces sp. NPDC058284]|uniref:chaplin n=1 Tax=unclassified Streptomyces TaxID=2593676 RepID=UPI0036566D47
MLSAAAATSILSLSGAHAFATSGADGQASDSPGILSGNNVQAPLEVPVNACGNTVNAAAVGNPAFGNKCGPAGSHHSSSPHHPAPHHPAQHGSASPRTTQSATVPEPRAGQGGQSGAGAQGSAADAPGAVSGNNAHAPVDAPVKACGNTVGIVAALSNALGNKCGSEPPHPDAPHSAPPHADAPPAPHSPEPRPRAMPHAPRHTVPEDPAAVPETAPRHTPHGTRVHLPAQAAAAQDQLAMTGGDPALLVGAGAGLLLGGAILYRRGFAGTRR